MWNVRNVVLNKRNFLSQKTIEQLICSTLYFKKLNNYPFARNDGVSILRGVSLVVGKSLKRSSPHVKSAQSASEGFFDPFGELETIWLHQTWHVSVY
jgi:hypothetical protein